MSRPGSRLARWVTSSSGNPEWRDEYRRLLLSDDKYRADAVQEYRRLTQERPADPQGVFRAVVVGGLVNRVAGGLQVAGGAQLRRDHEPLPVDQGFCQRMFEGLGLTV